VGGKAANRAPSLFSIKGLGHSPEPSRTRPLERLTSDVGTAGDPAQTAQQRQLKSKPRADLTGGSLCLDRAFCFAVRPLSPTRKVVGCSGAAALLHGNDDGPSRLQRRTVGTRNSFRPRVEWLGSVVFLI
jgi:hypothetical protein